jgi:SAM-dependent methyltransferase
MASESVYRWLDKPWVFRLIQATLAAGVEQEMTREIGRLLERLPPAHRVLDVGCGPKSRLWRAAVQPIGLDRSVTYLAHFRRAGQPAVAASSSLLPFANASFDAVWCFAMLHHVPDDAARTSIQELLRVTRPGGYVVVHDWNLPESAWRRPGAWALLRADRGRFMRKREQFLALLPRRGDWSSQSGIFSLFRCDGLFCVFQKPA